MLAARVLARAAAPRTLVQRRLVSSNAKADGNAFIREREAVKKHAAESAGTPSTYPTPAFSYHVTDGR